MQRTSNNLTILLLITTFLIMLLALFILFILSMYNKRQIINDQIIKNIEEEYQKNLLTTQLEIQEQTFLNISREIHDNINLSLTLAKLYLNTLNIKDEKYALEKVEQSVELVSEAIEGLTDISKSLNSDIIKQQGLIKAIEQEIIRITNTDLIEIKLEIIGNPYYLESNNELFIFRIFQESFNNILRHAKATQAKVALTFHTKNFRLMINDNGVGFDTDQFKNSIGAGLTNMRLRCEIMNGKFAIISAKDVGTTINLEIPIK